MNMNVHAVAGGWGQRECGDVAWCFSGFQPYFGDARRDFEKVQNLLSKHLLELKNKTQQNSHAHTHQFCSEPLVVSGN